MLDAKSAALLISILAIVGTGVLVADAIIFIRWAAYLWEKYRVEDEAAAAMAQAQQSADAAGAQDGPRRLAEREVDAMYADGAAEPMNVAGTPETEPVPAAADMPELEAVPVSAGTAETSPPFRLDLPPYPFARTWSLVDPFLALQFVFVVSQIVIGAALLPIIMANPANSMTAVFSPMGIIIQCVGLFFMNALFVGVTAFYIHRYRLRLSQIGLGRPNLRLLATGVGLGLLLFVVASGGEMALGALLPLLLPKTVMDGLTEFTKAVTAGGMFGAIPSLQLKIFFALGGAVAAPIGEELFFRGLLFNALKERLNLRAAIVISGLIFALVHFGPLAILIIFPMGMLLAYVYHKTGSLWITICMHATHNGLSFVLAMAFPHLGEPKAPVKPAPPPRAAVVRTALPVERRFARAPLPGIKLDG